MEIWTLLNGKGGVGKTTIATNVAHALVKLGHTVCLVDADPQTSVLDWQDISEWDLFPVVSMHKKQALKMLKMAIGDFDYVLIDTPGRIEETIGTAVALSNKVFIPVQPSPYDVWATSDIVKLIQERQDIAEGKPVGAFIISRAIKNTILGKEVMTALESYNFPVLKACTTQRVSYASSAALGQTVFTSKDTAASQEVIALVNEMLSVSSTPSKKESETNVVA